MSFAIRVLFFAGARERIGVNSIDVSPSDVPTIESLRSYLAKHHEGLAPLLPKIGFAVNEEYARDDTLLHPGDTVAVIPPVSGG